MSGVLLNLTGCTPSTETNPEKTVEVSTTDLTTNDFTPPEDFEWGWGNHGAYEMRLLSSRSEDGETFTFIEKVPMKGGSEINYFLSNELIADDSILRMYGFDLSKQGEIRSSTSTDGLTWIDEGLVHLELDTSTGLEGHYLKDPAVVQLNDGSYLMVYVTRVIQP